MIKLPISRCLLVNLNVNQSFKWSCLLAFNISNDDLFFETLNINAMFQKRVEFFKIQRESKIFVVI